LLYLTTHTMRHLWLVWFLPSQADGCPKYQFIARQVILPRVEANKPLSPSLASSTTQSQELCMLKMQVHALEKSEVGMGTFGGYGCPEMKEWEHALRGGSVRVNRNIQLRNFKSDPMSLVTLSFFSTILLLRWRTLLEKQIPLSKILRSPLICMFFYFFVFHVKLLYDSNKINHS
jgi:hypothetical protein